MALKKFAKMFPHRRAILRCRLASFCQCCPVPEFESEPFRELVRAALAEDIGSGDVTSEALLPGNTTGCTAITAREELTIAGLGIAKLCFEETDPNIDIEQTANDGDCIDSSQSPLRLHGLAHSILSAERTALNFLQRLSGIATLTSRYADAIKGTNAKLLDTRKTTPGWRALEKHAVACGGGTNHRMGLHDMVMIKDNHLAALRGEPKPIATAIKRAREKFPNLKIEVEADTLEQAMQATNAGADIILLDNMTPDQLRTAVEQTAGRCQLEASGGITLENIHAIAETGVDFISVGALTHSSPAADLALDWLP